MVFKELANLGESGIIKMISKKIHIFCSGVNEYVFQQFM